MLVIVLLSWYEGLTIAAIAPITFSDLVKVIVMATWIIRAGMRAMVRPNSGCS